MHSVGGRHAWARCLVQALQEELQSMAGVLSFTDAWGKTQYINIESKYKHLGSIISQGVSLKPEVVYLESKDDDLICKVDDLILAGINREFEVIDLIFEVIDLEFEYLAERDD